jgi:holo-[acyl-carrier protein] synthase
MIYGIGTDILRVSRVAKVHARHGERFVERLLHLREQALFLKQKKPDLYLAKAFAIKEAFVKALGTGFIGVAHDEVGSVRGRRGQPQLIFSEKLQKRMNKLGITGAHLSLSDDGDWVCAMVVLEQDPATVRLRPQAKGRGSLST